MIKIPLKALSLNSAYRGRRFKTPELQKYKEDIYMMLPKLVVPKGKLNIDYRFGVSSKNSDGDNLVKAFQDALSEAYGFNDKLVYRWSGEKVDVKKGEEFIEFEIRIL